MANVEWEIAGYITPKGEMRIGGFSLGGEPLFDEPLALEDMIASLSESHEVSADHKLSPEGRAQLRLLAETLSQAWTDVRSRLADDSEMKEEQSSKGRSKKADVVSLAAKQKAKRARPAKK